MRKYKYLILLLLAIFAGGCGIAPLVQKEASRFSVSFYLMVNQKSPSYSKTIVPAGSLVLSCGDYLTLRSEPTMTYADRSLSLKASLIRLLNLQLPKDNFYANNISAQNSIRLSTLEVRDNIATVRLDGKLESTGDTCHDGAMKLMIEKTVEQFGYKPNVLLNDSSREWQCLFSSEDKCQTVNTLIKLKNT